MDIQFLKSLSTPNTTRIVMLIMDGLGGLPREPGGETELETARTPNLDALAFQSSLGLSQPVGPGITAGSGPGHLALFGYDPIENEIGRGALEALGVDFDLRVEDVAARGNFCTVDAGGCLTDRRAGRLPTGQSAPLAALLETIQIEDVQFFVLPIKEHRFAFVMRGPGLSSELTETDPLTTGVAPMPVRALNEASQKAARLANQFIQQACRLLADQSPANHILLRGFAGLPKLPTFAELYGLRSAAIAVNGMYRGVSRLAGMQVLDVGGVTLEDEFATLERHWNEFDFFYLHVKQTDTAGEDGDFDRKVRVIEQVDSFIPRVTALNPDVIIVGGDHSSPAVLRAHSWHPVPLLLYGRHARPDHIAGFGERDCAKGSLGVIPARHILPLALANAHRLAKYGA